MKYKFCLFSALLCFALTLFVGNAHAAPAAAPKFLYNQNPDHSASKIANPHASFTVSPTEDGVEVVAAPSNEGYPGLAFAPQSGSSWDLSPWSHVAAKITNLGQKPLSLSMRVDNPGNWRESPWNAESIYLKPNETKLLKVFFGYQYGYQAGYALDASRISQVLFFLNGKSDSERRFRIEDLQASGAAGERPESHRNEAHVAHDGFILGKGAKERPRLEKADAEAAYSADGSVTMSFLKDSGRVTLRPAKDKPGLWNLRNFNRVEALLRNDGSTPAEFSLTLESPPGPTDPAKLTLRPGEQKLVPVSFIPGSPFILEQQKNGKHQCRKGSGTLFESNRTRSFTVRAKAGTKLTLLGVRASAPAVALPSWVGKKPPVPGNWELTLSEEFNKPSVNLSLWNIYTSNFWDRRTHFSKDNVILKDGKALLHYERKTGFHNDNPNDKSPVAKTGYACGFLDTYGKWTQTYGYFEARMKLPRTMGLWPAFWTMPDRGGSRDPAVNPQWKRSATNDGGMEFDILEHLTAWGPYRFNSAFHWDGYGKEHKAGGTSQVYVTTDPDGFMTIGMLWLPGLVEYYANGKLFLRWESDRVCSQPSYIILYMVSGGWANLPLDIQDLPADFEIDYVRVWQRKDLKRPSDGPQPNDGAPRSQF